MANLGIQESKEKRRGVPEVLCPFYERECPLGEEAARLCCRRLYSVDEAPIEYDDGWIDCSIAEWMFAGMNT